METTAGISDTDLVEALLESIASNFAMLTDRDFVIEDTNVERAHSRPEGKALVHISFRMGFETPDGLSHGCLLVPLPDAITLAAYLLAVPDNVVKSHRTKSDLDGTTKDAMLELSSLTGSAVDEPIRRLLSAHFAVRTEGCQGVRPDVRPAFPYEEGSELVVARSRCHIHDFPAFDMILMFPALPGIG
jgi:hypothetical protein